MVNSYTSKYIDVKASDLKLGDMVDLGDSLYFRDPDPNAPRLADYEYGVVGEIVQESPDCLVIDFGNIGTAGHDPDHIFKVRNRELVPPGWYERFRD